MRHPPKAEKQNGPRLRISCKAAIGRTQDNIVEIGERLARAKEAVGHGAFKKWVEVEFDLSYDRANDFMNAAKRFPKMETSPFLSLSQSAIFALAAPSVSDETRTLAVEKATSGELKTTRQVDSFIKERKETESLPPIAQSGATAPGFHINVAETQNYIKAKEDKEERLRKLSTPEEAIRFFLENETYLTGQPEFFGIWKRRARRAIQG